MSELSAHEVLVKARNNLATNGIWRDHGPSTGCGNDCAVLALLSVDYDSSEAGCAALAAAAGLVYERRRDSGSLYDWNDSHTDEEVLAAFDRAISATAPAPSDPLEGVGVREAVVS